MYQFKVRLYPELLKTREGLVLDNTLPQVREVARAYSAAGKKAVNKKWIIEESISIKDGDTLDFILVSDAWLKFPTKAVRSFISKLSKMTPYCELITPNGRLFKGESEFLGEKPAGVGAESVELSDEEAMVLITRLFFRETPEHRKKIEKIKEIVRE